LVSVYKDQIGTGFWAHTYPVDAARWKQRAVGLDRDLKAPFVQRIDQLGIELQQGFATRTHDEATGAGRIRGPARGDRVGQFVRAGEAAAIGTEADEIGVAEGADRGSAVGFATRPEIAPREPAED